MTVTGDDAETFLQGQLTQDLQRVGTSAAMPAAWCSPKGRVIATMQLLRDQNGFALLLPADIAEAVQTGLTRYVLRSKVVLELNPDQADEDKLDFSRFFDVDESLSAAAASPEGDLSGRLIRAGRVTIGIDNSEKFTPHMLSLDLAGAVSFDKGCYTGQEVVARTEHRGKSRRRLMRYECDSLANKPGDAMLDGEDGAGTVVNAAGPDVLAVVPVDLHRKVLILNGQSARPAALPWS